METLTKFSCPVTKIHGKLGGELNFERSSILSSLENRYLFVEWLERVMVEVFKMVYNK